MVMGVETRTRRRKKKNNEKKKKREKKKRIPEKEIVTCDECGNTGYRNICRW